MDIRKLKEPYRSLALLRKAEATGDNYDLMYATCFDWCRTPERFDFWNDIHRGTYPDIPQESLKDVILAKHGSDLLIKIL
jgi:hypothetical protein